MKSNFFIAILAFFTMLSWSACNKDSVEGGTSLLSNVQGKIMDESGVPLQGAVVTFDNKSATTDVSGHFLLSGVNLKENGSVLKCTKTGYKDGFHLLSNDYATVPSTTPTKNVRLRLYQKGIDGTVVSSTGGRLTFSDGVELDFPANAFKNADGTPYNGTVNVDYSLLLPNDDHFAELLPGSLVGVRGNSEGALASYSMIETELTDNAGNKLQIADGKKVNISFPIEASMTSQAPNTIPLWHMDESTGKWIEEGSATLVGNRYVGEVSHFSWWNCDMYNAIIELTFRLVDQNGNPLGNTYCNITGANTYLWHSGGNTDAAGYAQCRVSPNELLNFIATSSSCGYQTIHSQNIGPFTTDTNLGNIVVTLTGNTAPIVVRGTIADCQNAPIATGIARLLVNGEYFSANADASGNFSLTLPHCLFGQNAQLRVTNLTTLIESPEQVIVLNSNTVAVGTIQACGNTITDFIEYIYNGGAPILETTNVLLMDSSGVANPISIIGYDRNQGNYISISINAIANTGTYPIQVLYVYVNGVNESHLVSGTITITQWGTAIGSKVSGTFTAQVVNASGIQAPITGRFSTTRR